MPIEHTLGNAMDGGGVGLAEASPSPRRSAADPTPRPEGAPLMIRGLRVGLRNSLRLWLLVGCVALVCGAVRLLTIEPNWATFMMPVAALVFLGQIVRGAHLRKKILATIERDPALHLRQVLLIGQRSPTAAPDSVEWMMRVELEHGTPWRPKAFAFPHDAVPSLIAHLGEAAPMVRVELSVDGQAFAVQPAPEGVADDGDTLPGMALDMTVPPGFALRRLHPEHG